MQRPQSRTVADRRRRAGSLSALMAAALYGALVSAADPSSMPFPDASLPDPMRPALGKLVAQPTETGHDTPGTYVLQAIKIERHHRSAIINQQQVTEGSVIGRDTVLKISPGDVVIGSSGQQIRLRLNPNDIKKPAQGEGH